MNCSSKELYRHWPRVKVIKPGPNTGPLWDSTMSGTAVHVFLTCQHLARICLLPGQPWDLAVSAGRGPQPSVPPLSPTPLGDVQSSPRPALQRTSEWHTANTKREMYWNVAKEGWQTNLNFRQTTNNFLLNMATLGQNKRLPARWVLKVLWENIPASLRLYYLKFHASLPRSLLLEWFPFQDSKCHNWICSENNKTWGSSYISNSNWTFPQRMTNYSKKC